MMCNEKLGNSADFAAQCRRESSGTDWGSQVYELVSKGMQ